MSEPTAEAATPPASAAGINPPARRFVAPLLVAASAIIVAVAAIAATPFWAPAVMSLLPWSRQTPVAEAPSPPAPDPALAALKTQASRNAALLQALAQRVASLEAKPAPAQPDLAPIEQQLGALGKSISALDQHVATLDHAVQAQPASDPKNAALSLVLLQIRAAIDTGRPFAAEYRALVALARDRPDIAAAAEPLAMPAESGVASRAVLAERLRQLAPQIATARPPPNPGWKSQIVAQLRSLVTVRRIDEGAGQSPAEAAVGAAQRDLAGGDLAAAVAALDGLGGAHRGAAQPWLDMAKARLDVETALRRVETALAAVLGNPPAGKG